MAFSLFFLVVQHFGQPLSVLIYTLSWLNWRSLNNYNHLPVSIWYLDAELGTSLLARCWLVILCTSCQHSTDGMGRQHGKPGRYHQPPSPPHQLHQQHATCFIGSTHPLLWQKLTCPPAPQNNRVSLHATCVEQPELPARWSLNKFSVRHWETSRSLGMWHFIKHGINIYYWKKTARKKSLIEQRSIRYI